MLKSSPVQIAIDGPVGSGKSTISKLVAKKLGLLYIDTGAMYRAAALNCLRANIDIDSETAVCKYLSSHQPDFQMQPPGKDNDGRNCTVTMDGQDVSWEIRSNEVTLASSVISQYACVRKYLVEIQQKLANNGNVVMEGRDITYRVLPDADLKIYLTASEMVRALRRQIHLLEHGQNGGLEKIRQEIRDRDARDIGRLVDPLKKIPEAIEIDTSEMIIEEVVEKIVNIARNSKGSTNG